MLPIGPDLHYNALTADVYPTWEALDKGSPTDDWSKAVPSISLNDYLKKAATMRDLYAVELYRVTASVHPK